MKVRLKNTGLLLVSLIVASACPATDFASLLPPPKGAKVAIVLFQDLEWPDCAAAYPVIREAAQSHNVPVVIHDFPLPRHSWSFQAAINGRFFAERSEKLGDEFRGYILQNQGQITDEGVLRKYTEKFAADRQMGLLPVVLDPDGRLAQKVRADFALGQRLGLEHTPTLFVVSAGAVSAPMVETINRERLGRIIEDMQKNAPSGAAPARSRAPQRRKRT
jgi:protein-disulfide isomerase